MREGVQDVTGAPSNLYCEKAGVLNVESVKSCFEQRSTRQWADILLLHKSNLVVVTSDVKLNLQLEASNKYFNIYILEK